MRRIIYILAQTGRNLTKTWGAQLMTLLTVSLAVLIFTFFFLVYSNMLTAGKQLKDDLRLTLYLDDEAGPELQAQLRQKIRDFSEVEEIIFITRQEAYARLAAQLGGDRDILADLSPGFLPPSIEIYPKNDLKTLARIKGFSEYLSTLPGVVKVRYGHDWVERFGYFTQLLRIIVFLSGGLLVLTTTFIVSYTIKLTLAARREELEILRLLGASNNFIQVPFLVEGVLQGLTGSAIGLSALYVLFQWITLRFSGPGILNIFNFTFFPPITTTAILVAGIVLCATGSLLSIRKFLRI